MFRRVPYIIAGLFAAWIVYLLFPPKDPAGAFAFEEFGRLPVVANGRVQPFDSLARNSLLQLREKQTLLIAPWDSHSEKMEALPWMVEVMFNPAVADTRPVFRIDNPEVKGLLGLPLEANPAQQNDGKHYSWQQLENKLDTLQTEANRVGGIAGSKRTPYEQAVYRLFNCAVTYMRLENTLQPQDARDFEQELREFQEDLPKAVEASRAEQAGETFDKKIIERAMSDLRRFETMRDMEPPLPVPPANPANSREAWQRMGDALLSAAKGGTASPAIAAYTHMGSAYREGRVADFNAAVESYHNLLAAQFSGELKKTSHEQYFNHLQPFYHAMVIYLVAMLFALAFWFDPVGFEWLRRTAFWLVLLALVIHTSGLIFRMCLEGRPPVTNLYSSAIFIGWGACVLGLVLERFWRNSIGLMVSSGVGFITLIIAHHLSLAGDTMEMMRAVLDTNIWLSTHVVVVTLGYASTFVAGFLAIYYIIIGAFTKNLNVVQARVPHGEAGVVLPANRTERGGITLGQSLAKMVYGIICFATLFSFVGTVLGGIWADQSWGRFWGWDPKENGALIIVLWNALILHARWGGLVRERGLMNLAIGGNIVTAWSWFGVNMLGIGLHSYGFTDAAFRWLVAFVVSQLVLIVIGVLPRQFWRSFAPEQPLPAGQPALG